MPWFLAKRALAVRVLLVITWALAGARAEAQTPSKAPVEMNESEPCDGCCSIDRTGAVAVGAPAVRVLIMVDRSGSTREFERWKSIRKILADIRRVLHSMSPKPIISMMLFPAPCDDGCPYQDFPIVTETQAEQLLARPRKAAPARSGSCEETPLARAIVEASQWAKETPEHSVVVLLTDGTNTVDFQSRTLKDPAAAEKIRLTCDPSTRATDACALDVCDLSDNPRAMVGLTCRAIRCFDARAGRKSSLHLFPLPPDANAPNLQALENWVKQLAGTNALQSIHVHASAAGISSEIGKAIKREKCRIPLSAAWSSHADKLVLTQSGGGRLGYDLSSDHSVLQIKDDDRDATGMTSCEKFIHSSAGAMLSAGDRGETRCQWKHIPTCWSRLGVRRHTLVLCRDGKPETRAEWDEVRPTIVTRTPISGTDCYRIGICRDVDADQTCDPDKDAFVQFLVTCEPGLALDFHDPPPAATAIGGTEASEISPPGDRSALRLRTGMAHAGSDGGGFGLSFGLRPYRALRAAHYRGDNPYLRWYEMPSDSLWRKFVRHVEGMLDTLEVSTGIATSRAFPLAGADARDVGTTVNTLALSFDFFELARGKGGGWSWYPGSGASAISKCFEGSSRLVEEKTAECLSKGSNFVLGSSFLLDWQRVPLADLGGSTISAPEPRHFAWRILGVFRLPPDTASGVDRFAITGQIGQDLYLDGFIDKYLSGVRPPAWQTSVDMALQVAAGWRPARPWLELAGHTNVPDFQAAVALGIDLFWLHGVTISPAARIQTDRERDRIEGTFFMNIGGSATNSGERIPAKKGAAAPAKR